MLQPTKETITEKVQLVFAGKITRETLCLWATEFIRNDDCINVTDVEAWHYLVDVSGIDELIAPNKYLFSESDIREIVQRYV